MNNRKQIADLVNEKVDLEKSLTAVEEQVQTAASRANEAVDAAETRANEAENLYSLKKKMEERKDGIIQDLQAELKRVFSHLRSFSHMFVCFCIFCTYFDV